MGGLGQDFFSFLNMTSPYSSTTCWKDRGRPLNGLALRQTHRSAVTGWVCFRAPVLFSSPICAFFRRYRPVLTFHPFSVFDCSRKILLFPASRALIGTVTAAHGKSPMVSTCEPPLPPVPAHETSGFFLHRSSQFGLHPGHVDTWL